MDDNVVADDESAEKAFQEIIREIVSEPVQLMRDDVTRHIKDISGSLSSVERKLTDKLRTVQTGRGDRLWTLGDLATDTREQIERQNESMHDGLATQATAMSEANAAVAIQQEALVVGHNDLNAMIRTLAAELRTQTDAQQTRTRALASEIAAVRRILMIVLIAVLLAGTASVVTTVFSGH
jgi:hypothetical protein